MDQKDIIALATTKAIALQENGGTWPTNPTAGKSGEAKSIYQFTPATWRNYAGEILGNPNAPITPDNETAVVAKKVRKWLDQDYTPLQIASMWNAGQGEPNAYTGKFSNGKSSVGVNQKYNVPYDVPTYAKNVEKYTIDAYKKYTSQNPSALAQPAQNPTYEKSSNQSFHI